MTIKTAFSLDMDGCFDKLRPEYKIPYTWSEPDPELSIEKDRQQLKTSVIEHLKSIKLGEATTFIGSNRQSVAYELVNALSHHNGLAIDVIPHIAELIGSAFCPLLLSDFRRKDGTALGTTLPQASTKDHYGEPEWNEEQIRQLEQDDQIFRLTPGYSLTHFADGSEIPFTHNETDTELEAKTETTADNDRPHRNYQGKDSEKYLNSPWNGKKTEIIRRQIEFMRESMETDDILYFNFYDDREDILDALTEYFQTPGNLPDNVVLCLAQFNTRGMGKYDRSYSEYNASLIKYRLPIVNSIDLLDHVREHAPHLIAEDLRTASTFTLLLSGQFARADQLIEALSDETPTTISECIEELIDSNQTVATKMEVINHYAHLLTAQQHNDYCYEAISTLATDHWSWHTSAFRNKAINTLALVPAAYRKRCIKLIMASKISNQWKMELITDTAQLVADDTEYNALFIKTLQGTLKKANIDSLRKLLLTITANGRVPEQWLPITNFISAIITPPTSIDNIKQLLIEIPEAQLDTAIDCICNINLDATRKVELLDVCQSRKPIEALYESYQFIFYLQLQSHSLDGEPEKLLRVIPSDCIPACMEQLLQSTRISNEYKLRLLTQCWDVLPAASRDTWMQTEYLNAIATLCFSPTLLVNAIKVMPTELATACITATLERNPFLDDLHLFVNACWPDTTEECKEILYARITAIIKAKRKSTQHHSVTTTQTILTTMPIDLKRRWINNFIRDNTLTEADKQQFLSKYLVSITNNVALTADNRAIYTHVIKAFALITIEPPKRWFSLFACGCKNTPSQFDLLNNLDPDSDTPLNESIALIVALAPDSAIANKLRQATTLLKMDNHQPTPGAGVPVLQ
ncbi:MAG: hypothetical protein P1U40_08140 [Coxiellaceae bacterium]|nr:hypothetical protein [Coxiellaceae bacterium]